MTTTEDKPVDRDAWRRLLDGETEGPPELTDARIRAKARQALTPRTGRWWLPASLAASMLLAIVLVQQQYERPRPPSVISESDYAAAPAEAPAAAEPDDGFRDEALQRQDSRRAEAPAAATCAPPRRRKARKSEKDRGRCRASPAVVSPPLLDACRRRMIDVPARNDARE